MPTTALIAAVFVSLLCAVAVPTRGTAAAACPSSMRAVPGGTQDAEAGGRDDGVAGAGASYEPGQVLVQLEPTATPAAFTCVLRELDAGLVDGGRGRAGLARMPGLMLVQLGSGMSVARTVRLLNAPRYRGLVALAEPNSHLRTMVVPDDPLWPKQWGLATGSTVPAPQRDARGQTVDQAADAVKTDPTHTGPAESMRLEQAWDGTVRWFRPLRTTVQVAYIDDSLRQHADLAQNTSTTQSRVMEPVGFNGQTLRLVPRARQAFSINTGPGGSISCPIRPDASEDEMVSLFGRRVPMLCDHTGANVRTYMLEIQGDHGEVILTDGQGGSARISAEAILADDATADQILGARLFNFGRQLVQAPAAGTTAFRTLWTRGDLKVAVLNADDTCPLVECTRFTITADSPDLAPAIDPASRVTLAVDDGRRTYEIVGRTALSPLTAEVSTSRTVAKGRYITVKWHGPDLTGLVQEWKDPQSPMAIADVVEHVVADGDYRARRNDQDPRWPGATGPDANHGQAVAGLLAATANNGLGMAGVPGPNTKFKVTAIVAPLTRSALLEAIYYAAAEVHAKVVNISLGEKYDADEQPPDLIDTAGEDPRPTNSVQRQIARFPKTLFVLAAGNEATDHRRPGWRQRNKYQDKPASNGYCSPKGTGRTNYMWSGMDDGARALAKGGAVSTLRMPDGTFDRGNILCVAALAAPPVPRAGEAPVRRLADFSSWGRDVVDVAAPGENILTTGPNDQYRVVDGTSFAAPIVAGVATMVFWMNPGIDASKVKCAILSSATSAPLDPVDATQWPFLNIPNLGEPPLTVNGMVVATEALSAASALTGRRGKERGSVWTTIEEPRATCVQRRASRVWDAAERRWVTSGAWVNATRDYLNNLSSAPPPAPPANDGAP